jgi:hypothetical protein
MRGERGNKEDEERKRKLKKRKRNYVKNRRKN